MTNNSSSAPPNSISRRGLIGRLAAAGAAGAAAFRATEATASDELPRVVYHLADRDKVLFVLGNIDNHIKGMGGPDKVRIALVVHGPALLAFTHHEANDDLARRLNQVTSFGVDLGACGNTLEAQKLDILDLLPGFTRIPEGGVVRLAQLQAAGWAYIRP